MIIKLIIYPDLGKQTEDEIVDWFMEKIKNPPLDRYVYSPLKYVKDLEVVR